MASVIERLFDFALDKIDIWRSEEMQLVQLIIPAESAHDTIAALGDIGCLQFKDLNREKSAFQRTYANQVKVCEEMARKLRFFADQVAKAGLKVSLRAPGERGYDLDELEVKLDELERELLLMNSNSEQLQRSYNELVELQLVLEKAGSFFDSMSKVQSSFEATEENGIPLLDGVVDSRSTRGVGFVAGLIPQEKINGFERMLFRATRGNCYLKAASVGKVTDPSSGEGVEKHVFVVFFSGERSKNKIMKICEAFGANRYPFPEETSRARSMHSEVTTRLRELQMTLEAGKQRRETVLQNISTNLEMWTDLVRREKLIYHTLNKLSVDVTKKVLVAEAWVPTKDKSGVAEKLRLSAQESSTQINSILQPLATSAAPPTFYRTNKFTHCFQNIVDSYGIAKYREANPAVYTIMTFPFLFAVMFGDVGHGIIMLLFSSFLLINERTMMKKDLGDMVGMIFGGRYCIFLMSWFAIYTGLIYNEFFSMPLAIFGDTKAACYKNGIIDLVDKDARVCAEKGGSLAFPDASPYPFGVDPIWHGTKTELPYLNSVKMKMSIVMGVIHMDTGIIMSLCNMIFFRDYLSIWTEFIPQMIFLNFIFGYLVLLIIYKWYSGGIADLYHVMIYMFLSPGTVDEAGQVFPPGFNQAGLQVFLLLIAFIAVPWMLLPKPLVLKKRHEAAMKNKRHNDMEMSSAVGHSGHDDGHGGDGHGHGDHFEFGEIMVHQMIHTIEFVLGAVSNTASYLRLWALSLAHSQLSAVFYDRVLMAAIAMDNPFAMFIGFAVFACATLGVLMVMESLSAFLHALRLHWVEYQGKFYKGDGYKFAPFNFDSKVEVEEK